MSKPKLVLLAVLAGALAVAALGWLLYCARRTPVANQRSPNLRGAYSSGSKMPLDYRLRAFRDEHFPKLVDLRVDLTGTTGTPLVVGYSIDGHQSGVFRGVIPTNFTVSARRRLGLAVKNLGPNSPDLKVSVNRLGGYGIRSGIVPPFYGYDCEVSWEPTGSRSGGGHILHPTNWPVTLPPGMTEQEARTNDFGRDLLQYQLLQPQFAKNSQDPNFLWGTGVSNLKLKNFAAAEYLYAKFSALQCKDHHILNAAAYEYVENSGTNLERAYEIALQAQALAPRDRYIADTVGWVLHKRGDYQAAVPWLEFGQEAPGAGSTVKFHLAMAHYMSGEESLAREGFRSVLRWDNSPQVEQAKQCLEILDISTQTPERRGIAKLKAGLEKRPDDSVALDRLGAMFDRTSVSQEDVLRDPLISKAAGVHAYRRGEFVWAVQWLSESAKHRPMDAELFFFLGMAQNRLHQREECVHSLSKSIALHPGAAHAREAIEQLLALQIQTAEIESEWARAVASAPPRPPKTEPPSGSGYRLVITLGGPSGPSQPQNNICRENLRLIEAAKQQWATEHQKPAATPVEAADLTPYLRKNSLPVCPGGGAYTLNSVRVPATCSVAGHSLQK